MTTIVKKYANESLHDWANRTLTPTELDSFNAAFDANTARWQNYVDQGMISVNPFMQEVYISALNETVSVQIGDKTIISPEYTLEDVTLAPEWKPWLDRYLSEVNAPEITIE